VFGCSKLNYKIPIRLLTLYFLCTLLQDDRVEKSAKSANIQESSVLTQLPSVHFKIALEEPVDLGVVEHHIIPQKMSIIFEKKKESN